MIIVENLSKKFGTLLAVKDLNLHIKKGEFYSLLGPNGAGKTTTVKIIAGLMRPTQGRVLINGYDIEKEYIKVKQILGFIPDNPFLYENLTPYEFLRFIGDIFGVDKDKVLKSIDYYFEMFNLREYKDVLIKELSHGTKQKIVYISNFLHSPLVYLIDEPLVGLDPFSIHLLKKLLKEEIKKGRTILMCTHILSIAEELSDRIGILSEGELITQGSPCFLKEKECSETLEKLFLKLTQSE